MSKLNSIRNMLSNRALSQNFQAQFRLISNCFLTVMDLCKTPSAVEVCKIITDHCMKLMMHVPEQTLRHFSKEIDSNLLMLLLQLPSELIVSYNFPRDIMYRMSQDSLALRNKRFEDVLIIASRSEVYWIYM